MEGNMSISGSASGLLTGSTPENLDPENIAFGSTGPKEAEGGEGVYNPKLAKLNYDFDQYYYEKKKAEERKKAKRKQGKAARKLNRKR